MKNDSTLTRNLVEIRKRDADLAAALESAATDGVEVVEGPRGATALADCGIRLGSAYDPVGEGHLLAEKMAEEPADVMVAIGLGLGEQLAPYQDINPCTMIIYEPSLARLKAALARLSLTEFLQSHGDVYFVNDLQMLTRILAARYTPGLRLRVFLHPTATRLDQRAVAAAVAAVRDAKENVDIQRLTSIEMLMPWALMTAKNGRRISQTPQVGRLKDRFEGRPAVVVAAGPSLDKQLPLLREIKDRIVIVAIGQTAKALRKAKIEPDIIHILESRDVSHQLTEAGDTSTMILAPSADADPAIFDVPCRAQFTVTPLGGEMGVWIAKATGETEFTMGGGTVAQGAVGIAVLLGCNPIALIGQDLAFSEGRVYANDSAYDFVGVDFGEDGQCRFNNMPKKADMMGKKDQPFIRRESPDRRVVWVDGWTEGEKVPTWQGYASFLDQYREIGMGLRAGGWSLMNCTEGGARIPELEHRSFQSFADEFATDEFDAREMILEVYDSTPRFTLEDYRRSIEAARKLLEKVVVEATKGARFADTTRARLLSAKNDQQRVEVLRGLARHEKKVRRLLERIPWLDALVQPEIYNAIAAVRRTERQDPGDELLVNESAFLFEAAKNGVGRARHWFDAFESSFAEDVRAVGRNRSDAPLKRSPDRARSKAEDQRATTGVARSSAQAPR